MALTAFSFFFLSITPSPFWGRYWLIKFVLFALFSAGPVRDKHIHVGFWRDGCDHIWLEAFLDAYDPEYDI